MSTIGKQVYQKIKQLTLATVGSWAVVLFFGTCPAGLGGVATTKNQSRINLPFHHHRLKLNLQLHIHSRSQPFQSSQ